MGDMFSYKRAITNLLIVLLHISSSASLRFSFPSITHPNPSLITEGNINYLDSDQLQLTGNRTDQIGRVRYSQPLRLWDNSSGFLEEADFTTEFSFTIDSAERPRGDGLAFFLAQPPFPMPEVVDGSGIGLVGSGELKLSATPFVAVEFDTLRNTFDPQSYDDHVGINVNSMASEKTVGWDCNVGSPERYNATVNYDSATRNLSVTFTGYRDKVLIRRSLSHVIRLADYLPEFVYFGFSAANGLYTSTHILNSWSFDSNPETRKPVSVSSNSGTKLVVALSIAGCSVLISAISLICFFVWRKRNKTRPKSDESSDAVMDNEFERSSGARKFSYDELYEATNKFAKEEKLGEGGFGEVYRGFLPRLKLHVAVKRVSKWSSQGIKEYASEVKIVGRLTHKNLAPLLGWCHRNGDLLLIYDLMPNGSLDSHLFGRGDRSLTWEARFNIAQGLASALRYLHEECEKCVLHRDIKPSNVLLDSRLNAKLTDFGLARLVDHGEGPRTTTLAGTLGYLAPECLSTSKASTQSDVFGFGVVALEIASGLKATVNRDKSLSEWIWGLHEADALLEAADPKLHGRFDEHQMERLVVVGLWCSHPDREMRPSMKHVCNVLDSQAPLPVLRSTGSGYSSLSSGSGDIRFSDPILPLNSPSTAFLTTSQRSVQIDQSSVR